MLHKIFVNLISILNIINCLFLISPISIMQNMYASYGLADQIPFETIMVARLNVVFIVLIVLIICYMIFFNAYFNKKRRLEKPEKYKKTSIITYIIMGVIYILTTITFVLFILKPIMDVYMSSFLFEANGI